MSLASDQADKREVIRMAISAAAALVKVKHKMRSGGTPASNKRNTRSVKIFVFPAPADASTHAENLGSDASCCCSKLI